MSVGELGTNCWLVDETDDGPLIVIDPGGDPDRILDAIDGRTVEAIILTHAHFDHIGAVDEVRARTGASLMAHAAAAPDILAPELNGGAHWGLPVSVSRPVDRILVDGDTICAGEMCLEVLHTPGHSPGAICLFGPGDGVPHLFSGDTLFSRSVGRTDLPGGDPRELARSIALKLSSLPYETLVHPGHGPDTTIGREARLNPFWPRA